MFYLMHIYINIFIIVTFQIQAHQEITVKHIL